MEFGKFLYLFKVNLELNIGIQFSIDIDRSYNSVYKVCQSGN